MLDKYIKCSKCGGAMHPSWFEAKTKTNCERKTYLLDVLTCSICLSREVTDDMTPTEYRLMIKALPANDIVFEDNGR